MIDYLIVGCGLAGISFAETALKNNKSILVFDNNSQNTSRIAGGIYNPVILKRFSEVWEAQSQIAAMKPFYADLNHKIAAQLDYKMPVLRKFFSIEEQNNWFAASDKPALTPFLSTQIANKQYKGITAPFGYGVVLQTGYIDTALLLSSYRDYLVANTWFCEQSFDYDAIVFESDCICYKNNKARHVVFAEGFGLHSNPYFNHLPLDGTKGELVTIKAPDLNLDVIVNSSVFILPLGNQLFKIGATYHWKDKTNLPTEEGKTELLEKIREIIECDFEIVAHDAGVRPTVRDRRPLVGTHPIYKQIHVLNGLGTRGVMLGPTMAKALYDAIENQIPLDKEINMERFLPKKN